MRERRIVLLAAAEVSASLGNVRAYTPLLPSSCPMHASSRPGSLWHASAEAFQPNLHPDTIRLLVIARVAADRILRPDASTLPSPWHLACWAGLADRSSGQEAQRFLGSDAALSLPPAVTARFWTYLLNAACMVQRRKEPATGQ